MKGSCAPLLSPCHIIVGKASGKIWELAMQKTPYTCLQDRLFIMNGKATREAEGCPHDRYYKKIVPYHKSAGKSKRKDTGTRNGLKKKGQLSLFTPLLTKLTAKLIERA